MTPNLDELLDAASVGMDGVLKRMAALAPRDDNDWELEREAFGIEDPAIHEAELRAEEAAAAAAPVVDRPRVAGRPTWREVFRQNWPKPRGRE